jgi:GDP-4-dehydro-6-deoxy-D-mannose reductase
VSVPLITGAAGFAGSHLLEHLLETESSVAAWSNPGGRTATQTDPRVQWRAVDLLERSAVQEAIADLRPSAIYHCGGIANVGGSWSAPDRALRVNVLGTHHLLEGVEHARLDCPILVTGSALVYRPSTDPISEDSPIGPTGPYGVSKLAQEMLAFQASVGPTIVARPFNHAGPRQTTDYVTSAFAKQIAEIERGLAPAVLRVGNLESRRDITDVRDVVRAYRLLLAKGRPRRAYNVCSGTAHRVSDLMEGLVRLSRLRIAIEVDPQRLRPSDNPVVLGDRTRILEEVGWAPQIPIERTLADLLDHWRQHVGSASAP